MAVSPRSARSLSVLAFLLSAAATIRFAGAQSPHVITIEAGKVLEVAIATPLQNPELSWILAADHTFVTAQRGRIFQTRLALPRTYSLDVSIQDAMRTLSSYEAFMVNVIPPQDGSTALRTQSGTLTAILRTNPPASNGVAQLPDIGGVLTLDPSASLGAVNEYALDFDASVDANGDGDPQNDRDNQGAFGQRDGTPLQLFIPGKSAPQTVTLTVRDGAGQEAMSRVQVLFSGQANVITTVSNIAVEANGLTVRPAVLLGPDATMGRQLLTEWDFGDQTKSLLDRPEHTYARAGTYVISARVRDIQTGQVIFLGQTNVDVRAGELTSSVASSPDQQSEAGDFSFSSALRVLLIIAVITALAVGLFALWLFIRRRAGKSLDQTFETMESKLFEKKAGSEKTEREHVRTLPVRSERKEAPKPAPQAEKPSPTAAALAERELSHGDFKTKERAADTPATSAGPVPTWLKPPGTPPPPPPPSPAPSTSSPSGQPSKPPAPSAPNAPTTPPPPPKPKPAPPAPAPRAAFPPQPKPASAASPSQPAKPSLPLVLPRKDDRLTDENLLPDWLKEEQAKQAPRQAKPSAPPAPSTQAKIPPLQPTSPVTLPQTTPASTASTPPVQAKPPLPPKEIQHTKKDDSPPEDPVVAVISADHL